VTQPKLSLITNAGKKINKKVPGLSPALVIYAEEEY
jgi:hypothetical protein